MCTGSFTRMSLRSARTLTGDDGIHVLSALHDLLPLTIEIDPYDLRLDEDGTVPNC